MSNQADILALAQRWHDQDPDPETRAELSALIHQAKQDGELAASAQSELTERFSGRLAFGTAGLRGPLQAGPTGMNRVLVGQAAAGLARYLVSKQTQPSVVIGYDGRKNSDVFARDTAEIMQASGVKAYLLPKMLPTPVLAFAVRALDASAGVMVTASHNPPKDNGYKVYLGNDDAGAQIVPPADKEIAENILWVAENQQVNELPRDGQYTVLDDDITLRYIKETAKLITQPAQPIKYVYTAMHGVGCETLLRTLRAAGLPEPILVQEQCTPDGTFPTVAFPNPEEKGALDLAIATAKKHGAEFIIANDPDADRLAVSIPDSEGNWFNLHGNDVGRFLGYAIATQAKASGKKGTLACSLVSTPALAKIAKATGMDYRETLTGFKWIGRTPNLIFGFEEALGYLVDPEKVHDKDGISAALAFLNLILELKQQGKTLQDYSNELDAQFGAYASGQVSIRVQDLSKIGKIMAQIRQQPPQKIADYAVTQFTDHEKTELKNNILVFQLENGARITIRPSGTEPKVKCYLDTVSATRKEAQMLVYELEQAMRTLMDS